MYHRTRFRAASLLVAVGVLGVFQPAIAQSTGPAAPVQPHWGIAWFPLGPGDEPAVTKRAIPATEVHAASGGEHSSGLFGWMFTRQTPVAPRPFATPLRPTSAWSVSDLSRTYVAQTRWSSPPATPAPRTTQVAARQVRPEDAHRRVVAPLLPVAALGRPTLTVPVEPAAVLLAPVVLPPAPKPPPVPKGSEVAVDR
jgi:hypothetical protein